MLRAISITLMAVLILLLLGVGALLFQPETSTGDLDGDISNVQRDIAAASAESAKYSSGLIKTMIDLRSSVLQTTESMLEAKRLSWLHRVRMTVIVEGRALEPVSADALAKIAADIRATEQRIAEAEAKSRQYSGGLIQSLALMNAETERVTRSQLLLAYYSGKHGLALPALPAIPRGNSPDSGAAPPLGVLVPDKDAL